MDADKGVQMNTNRMSEHEPDERFSLEMLGPGQGVPSAPQIPTKKAYVEAVSQRWGGWALQDAIERWDLLMAHREDLDAWIRHFRRDCWFKVGDKCFNRDGTIRGMLWLAAESTVSLRWLVDFEERLQKVFLARGAQHYVELVLGLYERESTPM